MKAVSCFETTDAIGVTQLGDDDCLLDFDGKRVVLSYDAAYDLALRLAYFVQHVGEGPAVEPPALLN